MNTQYSREVTEGGLMNEAIYESALFISAIGLFSIAWIKFASWWSDATLLNERR